VNLIELLSDGLSNSKNKEEKMDLKEYFENNKGLGVLATADSEGKVDLAVYSKPHFMDDGTIAFIMADRLTHHNLQSNDHAAYMFVEESSGYNGIRLFLTKLREEQDSDLLYSIRSKLYPPHKEEGKTRFLVFFKVDKELPLIGAEREKDTLE
jgi:hypothetical protein